ncbi:hypothetical protein [Pyxidicoccus trucidator]|uniref:hypothetical protein n=1 Tax=Pyxidicoccus trucidator TaxID=2709662 RepID=UPI0013D9B97A|nr:hypothetical protein [Pyxidicoccus trucidator]
MLLRHLHGRGGDEDFLRARLHERQVKRVAPYRWGRKRKSMLDGRELRRYSGAGSSDDCIDELHL